MWLSDPDFNWFHIICKTEHISYILMCLLQKMLMCTKKKKKNDAEWLLKVNKNFYNL